MLKKYKIMLLYIGSEYIVFFNLPSAFKGRYVIKVA